MLAASRGQAAALAVLHHRLRDPLNARVVADGRVRRVHGDHLHQKIAKRKGGGQSTRPELVGRNHCHVCPVATVRPLTQANYLSHVLIELKMKRSSTWLLRRRKTNKCCRIILPRGAQTNTRSQHKKGAKNKSTPYDITALHMRAIGAVLYKWFSYNIIWIPSTPVCGSGSRFAFMNNKTWKQAVTLEPSQEQ